MPDIQEQELKRYIMTRFRGHRTVKEKIHKAYAEYLKNGSSAEDATNLCLTRFADEFRRATGRQLTQRVFVNIVSRPMGAVADSLTEATILMALESMLEDLNRLHNELESQIEELQDLREDGADFAIVKRKNKSGDIEEDEIPINKAIVELMKQQLELHEQFGKRLTDLMPRGKDGVNIFVGEGGSLSMMSDEDLRSRIKENERRIYTTAVEVPPDGNNP